MEGYKNVELSPEERARDLLARLSLEEKVRQLGGAMAIPIMPWENQDLRGGIGVANVMATGENPAEQIKAAQEYIIENSPHRIPALLHGEALSGPVSFPGGSVYPISIGMGATFTPELVEEMADATRQQLVAGGIRHALSPVGDLARDFRWGRTNETYGNDPTLSAEMMVSFVKGMQGFDIKEGVAATGKHFFGYSQTEGGLNCHKTMINPRELREQHAKPFEAAIRYADLKTVMNSYSEIDGLPVCANKGILTDLLRNDLGFTGVVVSDYASIPKLLEPFHLVDNITEAGIRCLEAGLDVECPTRSGYGDGMIEAVESEKIDIAFVDRSVLRILTLKFELGLFEQPYPIFEQLPQIAEKLKDWHEGSYQAALKSITLLKNTGILPISDRHKKILVCGPAGNCLRMLFSHYTAVTALEMLANLAVEGDTQQGYEIADMLTQEREEENIADKYMFDEMIRQLYPGAKTTFEGLAETYDNIQFIEGCDYKGSNDSGIDDAVKAAREADIVVMAVGGKNGLGQSASSGEGVDSVSLDLPGQQEQLMREVFAANPNMIIIHTDGRPMVSEWAYENVPAIIEGWLPNAFGGNALAAVVSGQYNPAGRTPVDVPRSVGHMPVYHCQANGSSGAKNRNLILSGYIDADASVLAPFGYGLSYTTFSYADFKMELNQESGEVRASVKVTNAGDCDGEEVVQLYGSDLVATMIRPIHELVGFKRIFLQAGEAKIIEFDFNIDFFAFLGQDNQWVLEKGDFLFTVGAHSDDTRAQMKLQLGVSKSINSRERCLYALVKEGVVQ